MRAWFRALLRLFPADFRGDYGREMQETFGEELQDAGGRIGRVAVARRNLTAALRLGPRLHLEQIAQDVRYAVRALRGSPVFTIAAAGALAFGIGSTVSTFALADAFLLRPLPFDRPAGLVHIWAADRSRGYDALRASLPEYESWRARSDLFADAAIFNYTAVEVTSGPEPESIPAGRVTANAFELLGIAPIRGRALQKGDDEPGAAPVVVLSEGFWRTRFEADDQIVGRTLAIAGTPHTIVGVMPSSFVFPLPTTRLWVARTVDRARLTPDVQIFQVVARLRPGVSQASAESALAAAAPALAATHPALAGRTVHLQPLRAALNFADEIFTVGAVVIGLANLMVLFTACANISSLMLGRAVTRGREVAIRAAIGASRLRLIRQFLVESLLLAGVGALLGLALAAWGLGLADRFIPGDLYRAGALAMDLRAALVAGALAIGSALLFGLTPALRFARADLNDTMRQDSGATTTSRRSLRLQSFFVQKQVALSVVLLVGTVLIARSFAALGSVDPGFQPDGVLTLQVSLPATRYPDAASRARFHAEVVDRVTALPGVETAATVDYLPLNHEYNTTLVRVAEGADAGGPLPEAALLHISAGYFDVMRTPVIEGRAFERADTIDRARVAIVNATLARRHWPDRPAIGGTIRLGRDAEPHTVVGVVADTRQVDLSDTRREQVFLPQAQRPTNYLRVLARTRADAAIGLVAAAGAIHAVDPLLPVNEPRTLRQVVDDFLLPERSLSLVLLVLGGFSLWLALFGIYGIVSCYVADRTREIGLRSALGATEGQLVRFVMGRGLRLAIRGGIAGLALAIAAAWGLRGMLYGVAAADPVTYVVVVSLVVAVAVGAGLLPARRAARVNPVVALRA